jgi:hypothetical protein
MPEGRHASWKYPPRPGTRLSVTFGTPVLRGSLGTMMRDVPATAEEVQRKDREVRIDTHGCRTACGGGPWPGALWGSARWPGAAAAATITTATEEDMKRNPWLAGLIRTVHYIEILLPFVTFHRSFDGPTHKGD